MSTKVLKLPGKKSQKQYFSCFWDYISFLLHQIFGRNISGLKHHFFIDFNKFHCQNPEGLCAHQLVALFRTLYGIDKTRSCRSHISNNSKTCRFKFCGHIVLLLPFIVLCFFFCFRFFNQIQFIDSSHKRKIDKKRQTKDNQL